MAIPVAMIALGAGMQAYGTYMSSRSAAKAARQQARIKKAQAAELLERMHIQEERINIQGDDFKAKQLAEYASNGVQLGTGATLVAMEDTNMKISQQVDDLKRDSMFKINQIKMGAKVDMDQASDISTAGNISTFGTLLGGAGEIYKKSK